MITRKYKQSKYIGLYQGLAFVLLLVNFLVYLNFTLNTFYSSIVIFVNLSVLILMMLCKGVFTARESKEYLYILTLTLYASFTLLLTRGGFGSVVSIVLACMIMSVFSSVKLTSIKKKVLFLCMLVVFIFWLATSWNYFDRFMTNVDTMMNSNAVGIIATALSMYLIAFLNFLEISKNAKKLLGILILLLGFYIVIQAQSRGALVALAAFAIFNFLIPKKFWKSKKRTSVIFFIIMAGGLLFPWILISFYERGTTVTIPFFGVAMFTGREVIWTALLHSLQSNPINFLFGLGSRYILPGYSFAHNDYLGLLKHFGLIGFILFYYFIFKQIKKIYSRNIKISNTQVTLLMTFLSFMVLGYFETIFLSGIFGLILYMGLAFSISTNPSKKMVSIYQKKRYTSRFLKPKGVKA